MNRRESSLAIAAALLSIAGPVLAQPAPAGQAGPVRLRGTIDAVSDGALDLVPRDGGNKVHVLVPADVRATYVVPAKLTDIQPDSYIGTAARPQPDGSVRALEVHVFPPSRRGSGEGSRPFDLEPGSTMTNGTVGSLTRGADRTAIVKHGNAETKVLIPDDVPVVTFEPADRSALKPGAKIVVTGERAADGTLTAVSVNIGKDGLTPPM